MSPKRFPKAVVIWTAAIPTVLASLWLSGYLYWQVQVGRALSELRRGPGKYASEPNHVDPDLLRIGSRGIPRFVDELDLALSRGTEDQAFGILCGLSDLIAGFYGEPAARAASERPRIRRTPEEMREVVREYREALPDLKKTFPPWWRWWKGSRRAP